MNLEECSNLPSQLMNKSINPFTHVASADLTLTLTHEKFDQIRSNCKYYSPNGNCTSSFADKNLNILHLNARSIHSDIRFDEFQLFISGSNVQWQVICISESWMSNEMIPLRQLDGYTGYFKNRKIKSGGGVIIYVSNNHIQHSSEIIMENNCLEAVFVQCQLSPSVTFIVGQIYRPPSMDSSLFINELNNCIEELDKMNKTTFLCGDFNIDLFSLLNDNHSQEFFNTLASYGYWPTITKTTRSSENKLSLIDNIFCNNLDFVVKSGIIYHELSDHFPIFVSCAPLCHPKKHKWHTVFDKNKLEELSSYLHEQLHDFTNIDDPETACNAMIDAYQQGIKKYSITIKHNRRSTSLKPWISPAILTSINRRHHLFMLKNQSPTRQNKLLYNNYRNKLNELLREAKRKYILNQLEVNKTNSRKLWQILNGTVRGKSTHNQLSETFKNTSGEEITDKNEIAESFNNFFISVGENLQQGVNPSDLDPLQYINSQPQHIFDTMGRTNATELHTIIKHLKNVGAGIDQINANIFKHTFQTIICELVHLMNLCLEQGIFPNTLKRAVVKPVYKSGDKKEFNNYRPISILPYISKILEKVIHIQIMSYVQDSNILNINQYGFQKNKSTYMPLLLLQENITKSFENGKIMCGIYLDLKKAFDTVDHSILLRKLEKYGFASSPLSIIKSYLQNRYQCVDYNEFRSTLKPVSIGVPQGSILGPLLFLLYINDFPNISQNAKFLMYADDTAIFFESDNLSALQIIIDQESNHICNWLQMNKLTLNTQKTVYQLYKYSNNITGLTIMLNGIEIKEEATVKYLGMFIDTGLKWAAHIDHLSLTLSRNIGIINRSKYFLNKQSMLLLYNALVLPYINYCCLVWGFTFPTYMSKIEILQKRVIRIIDEQPRLAHSDPIFKSLNILKLKDIAKQQLTMVMYRKFDGSLPIDIDLLFSLSKSPSIITRNRHHFNETFSVKNYRTRTASWIGPRLWNSIIAPHLSVADLSSTSKEHIQKHTKQHFILAYD